MNRRDFFRGTFGGLVGGALLVNGSDPPALEAEEPLIVIPSVRPARSWPNPGETLYNEKGEAVAWVTGVRVTQVPFDVTLRHDAGQCLIPGHIDVRIEATGFGVEETPERGLRLSGRRA